jgi:predicted transcriptional regulator
MKTESRIMHAQASARTELVKRMAELARATDSTPEELAAAVDAYQRELTELQALIQEGLDSGEPVDGDAVFARLRAKYRAMAAVREE